MAEVRPLAFYPDKPTGSFLSAVKAAKKKINTDILISPVRAVPGSPSRVISTGETPTWMCEHVVISPGSHEELQEAIEWALGIKENPQAVTVLTRLREVFGPDVYEIEDE